MGPMTALTFSTAALGLPGRFTMSVPATSPATSRERQPWGVIAMEAARMASGMPGRGCLRRDVAWREAGAARGQDQGHVRRNLHAQGRLYLVCLVGHDARVHDVVAVRTQQLHQGGAARVLPLAAGTAVTHGYDGCRVGGLLVVAGMRVMRPR